MSYVMLELWSQVCDSEDLLLYKLHIKQIENSMLNQLFHQEVLFKKCWGKQVQQFHGVTICWNSPKEQLENSTKLRYSKLFSIEYFVLIEKNWTVCTKYCKQLDFTKARVKLRLKQIVSRTDLSGLSTGYNWSTDPDTYPVRISLLVFLPRSCDHWKWQMIVGAQMLRKKRLKNRYIYSNGKLTLEFGSY